MATAAEPAPTETKAPVSRREKLLAAISDERRIVEQWYDDNPDNAMPRHYWPAVQNLVVAWSEEQPPDELQPLFGFVMDYAAQVRLHLLRWGERYREAAPHSPGGSDGVLHRGQQLEDAVARLIAGERPKQMETFAELVAQGVGDEQLAAMFGGVDRHEIAEMRKNPDAVKLTQRPAKSAAERTVDASRWHEFLLTAAVVQKLFEDPLVERAELTAIDRQNERLYSSVHFSGR